MPLTREAGQGRRAGLVRRTQGVLDGLGGLVPVRQADGAGQRRGREGAGRLQYDCGRVEGAAQVAWSGASWPQGLWSLGLFLFLFPPGALDKAPGLAIKSPMCRGPVCGRASYCCNSAAALTILIHKFTLHFTPL